MCSTRLLNHLRRLSRMTALRLSVCLTFLCLVILLIVSLIALLLVKHQLGVRFDAELHSRHKALKEKLVDRTLAPNAFGGDQYSFTSYRSPSGEIYGVNVQGLFDITGYHNLHLSQRFDEENDEWRVYVEPADHGQLAVAASTEVIDESLEIIYKAFATTGLIVSVILLGSGSWVGWRAQQRYDRIVSTLEAIAAGDLSARILPTSNRDDLDHVAKRIDETADRLEILLHQIRNLSANIAHDLKTPLARLRIHLEAPLHGQEMSQELDDALTAALAQVDQMATTFDALLRIANVQSGDRKKHFSSLNLADLVHSISEIYSAVAEDSGHQFHVTITRSSMIQGDRALLIQLLANLIENAIRYMPSGGDIRLTVESHILSVADSGPGIPIPERAQVLQHLYRLDKSRSTPGTGLGLALVKAIADLHDAELILDDNPTPHSAAPGLKVSLLFPYISNFTNL